MNNNDKGNEEETIFDLHRDNFETLISDLLSRLEIQSSEHKWLTNLFADIFSQIQSKLSQQDQVIVSLLNSLQSHGQTISSLEHSLGRVEKRINEISEELIKSLQLIASFRTEAAAAANRQISVEAAVNRLSPSIGISALIDSNRPVHGR